MQQNYVISPNLQRGPVDTSNAYLVASNVASPYLWEPTVRIDVIESAFLTEQSAYSQGRQANLDQVHDKRQRSSETERSSSYYLL